MSDEERRLECLRLASGMYTDPKMVLNVAQTYFNFLKGILTVPEAGLAEDK